MNYLKIYYQLVASAAGRPDDVLYERHHIVPRGLGGPDIKANIIFFTPKEHVIAHHLLAKAYPNVPKLQVGFNVRCLWKYNYFKWMNRLQDIVRDLQTTNNKHDAFARVMKLLNTLDASGIDDILPAIPNPDTFVQKPKAKPRAKSKLPSAKPINKVKNKLSKAAECEIRKIQAIPDEALQPRQ